MAKQTFTPQQKREYFAQLRKEWQAAKAAADGNGDVEDIYKHLQSMGITGLSTTNIMLVNLQAESAGFAGLPYVDFKTYKGWRESGFQVRKGESSQVHTITWVSNAKEEDNEDAYRWPKATHLFHSSQVDPIA